MTDNQTIVLVMCLSIVGGVYVVSGGSTAVVALLAFVIGITVAKATQR